MATSKRVFDFGSVSPKVQVLSDGSHLVHFSGSDGCGEPGAFTLRATVDSTVTREFTLSHPSDTTKLVSGLIIKSTNANLLCKASSGATITALSSQTVGSGFYVSRTSTFKTAYTSSNIWIQGSTNDGTVTITVKYV